jgi:DNA-binding transcriptional LysR family regulator
MHRDGLDGVVTFLRVAERRSFTAAAAELRVTPAAVSHAIKQLEARIGVALFARTTRDVGLTEAGRRFLEHARPGLAQLAEAFEAARRLGDAPSGLLRLNVPRLALPGIVEPLLGPFRAAYPAVEVEITVEDRSVNIVEGGLRRRHPHRRDAGGRHGRPASDVTLPMCGRRLTRLSRAARPPGAARRAARP